MNIPTRQTAGGTSMKINQPIPILSGNLEPDNLSSNEISIIKK